ncbi:type II toxin-antitoxin system PemK/MazF family toxin [Myxosarcina sp. GI1]|uniref:type II toxin-antitoxin system PemK/MazF family toxin n=1 Tax=Myxosarcina sp. GI1 TaxID=1541065 RepID=UPI000A763D16|nr:type II toxin-antitoxin system PemK/MazF family toxin [Myxosarcina sp. GI1]
MVSRGEVYLLNLDPTIGSEVQKTRPCLVVSPDEMNQYIRTVVIAPMTTKVRNYKSRAKINFDKRDGEVMLDQIRTIDKKRLIAKLGALSVKELKAVLLVLQKMFAY